MSKRNTYWLDRKENVTLVYRAVWAICILLLLVDPLVHKHEAFSFAEWFGFFGFFGFFACVGLVLTAKALRRVLKRAEDYYEH